MPVGSGSIPWPTATSLMSTLRMCDAQKMDVRVGAPVGCSLVTWARNVVAGEFLKTDFTHLFWIDSDIVWTPNDFFRLVGFGAVHDIIGATYPFKSDPPQVVVNTVGNPGEYQINGYGNVKVKSLGLGFTIVQRAVIEKLAASKPVAKDAINNIECADIFRIGRRKNGEMVGEDIAFFDDARELGFCAWLDPSITLGHVGQKTYRCDVIGSLGLQDYAKEKQE
jgi:hypothetical protein